MVVTLDLSDDIVRACLLFAVLWPSTVVVWALFSYLVWFHPYRRAKRLSGPPRDARGRFTRTPDSK